MDPSIDTGEGLTLDEQLEGLRLKKESDQPAGGHFFDTNPECLRHRKLVLQWWNYERAKQMDSRAERMKCHDYVDGKQWDVDEADELELRGQTATVFNLIKSTHDWLVGTERRMRYAFNVLPASDRPEAAKGAEVKTKLLHYLDSVNKARHARSLRFKDQVISGLGWMDTGIRSDPDDEPIFTRYEDWRNVWHDSCGKQWDGEDWRYIFRQRIADFDIAAAMFPDRVWAIRMALASCGDLYSDEFDESDIDPELAELAGTYEHGLAVAYRRDRVRLIACEYRMPCRLKVLRGAEDLGTLRGAEYDPQNEGMVQLVDQGHAEIYDSLKLRMFRMVMCGGRVLQWQRRKFNHNRFSLVPAWCYRKKRDGTPYGVPLQQIGPQDDVNKRFSKALWHLSANQAIIEEGAWGEGDKEEFFDEIDRPDGKILVTGAGKVQFREYNAQLGQAHVALAGQSARYIESIGGVTDENRGVETNATSGKAITARQDQGFTNTAEIYDNSLLGFQLEGEILLSLAEQFCTTEKVIGVTGDAGALEFLRLNAPGADGSMQNDISSDQAIFMVDAVNYHATVRQAMSDQLGAMIAKLPPEIALALIDIWLDLSDLPYREASVKRIRKMTGAVDPKEDPNSPEAQARQQAEDEEAQRQKFIQDKMIELELAMAQASIDKTSAEAERNVAQARATIASIRQKMEEVRIKKATALNQIEARRQQALLPPPGGASQR